MTSTEDNSKVPSGRSQETLDELSRLLVRQIACAREGNLGQVEQLAARADGLVAGMIQSHEHTVTLNESQRAHLKRLYDELTLALRAERSDVQSKLRQLRQVKRAVGAYGRKARTRSSSHAAAFGDGGTY
jgi:hypothetical protein